MSIADRIRMIVAVKSESCKNFAKSMGWSASYLSKLMGKKERIGLTPVLQLLDKHKDINARWLLFGKGEMFDNIEGEIYSNIEMLLKIERFIPVITKEEQLYFFNVVKGKQLPIFSDDNVKKWSCLFEQYEKNRNEIIRNAMKKSVKGL